MSVKRHCSSATHILFVVCFSSECCCARVRERGAIRGALATAHMSGPGSKGHCPSGGGRMLCSLHGPHQRTCPCQGCLRMADNRRRSPLPPLWIPPAPTDQNDHRVKRRNLLSRNVFLGHTLLGLRPPPLLSSNTSLAHMWPGCALFGGVRCIGLCGTSHLQSHPLAVASPAPHLAPGSPSRLQDQRMDLRMSCPPPPQTVPRCICIRDIQGGGTVPDPHPHPPHPL